MESSKADSTFEQNQLHFIWIAGEIQACFVQTQAIAIDNLI